MHAIMIIHAWLRTRYHELILRTMIDINVLDGNLLNCDLLCSFSRSRTVHRLSTAHRCGACLRLCLSRLQLFGYHVKASEVPKRTFSHPFFKVSAEYSLAEHDHQKLTGSTSLTALVVFGRKSMTTEEIWQFDKASRHKDVYKCFFHASSSCFLDASGKPKLTEVAIIHSWLALELAVAYMRLAGCGWPTDSMSANWNSMIQRKQRYWFHASEATLLDEADSLK